MWWVKVNPDQSRGGFQNRDVGKTNFGKDFGPDYGIDYARFADPPNLAADALVAAEIREKLQNHFEEYFHTIEILVRNGFVILKGSVPNESIKRKFTEEILLVTGVHEVINQLQISKQ